MGQHHGGAELRTIQYLDFSICQVRCLLTEGDLSLEEAIGLCRSMRAFFVNAFPPGEAVLAADIFDSFYAPGLRDMVQYRYD
mgnify:CR=1 FL=1